MDTLTRDRITQARAAGDTDTATAIESDYEAELARSGDEEAQAAAGYNPEDLAKEYGSKGGSASVPDNATTSKLSGSATRDDLETRARELGIENPDDRDKFPNKPALIEAIEKQEG